MYSFSNSNDEESQRSPQSNGSGIGSSPEPSGWKPREVESSTPRQPGEGAASLAQTSPPLNTERKEAQNTIDTKTVSEEASAQKAQIPPLQIFAALFLLLALSAAGAAAYFYTQVQDFKRNPQAVAQKEAQELIERVSRLIVLPEGETPTIATVTDPEALKDQPFFAKAKKGDKVLLYTNARKAILYDPVAGKILEVAPVNIGTPQPEEPTPTPRR